MHYKVRAKTSIPAVILWCKWTAVTTSKLCPDYNLAVLTSFVQEKKKLVESFSVKATVCNFPPRGIKVNSEFLPQHLSLTLMSCLSWNSTLPGAKITHIPPSCHRRRRSRCQTEKEGEKKKKSKADVQCVSQLILSAARQASHWVLPLLWLLLWLILTGTTSIWLHPQTTGFKCPEHHWKVWQTSIGIHRVSGTDTLLRMDHWGLAGLQQKQDAFGGSAQSWIGCFLKMTALCCLVPFPLFG